MVAKYDHPKAAKFLTTSYILFPLYPFAKVNMSKKEKTWDDLLLTEEEIKIYMQKDTIPFDSKTIFGTTDEQKEQVQSEPNGPRLIKK